MKTNNNSKKKTPINNKKEVNKTIDKIQWKEVNTNPRNIYADLEYKIDPIKIIYKYRNINRKNQYIVYIYLGILGKKYEKILDRIENLDLYDSLIEITKEEEIKLIEGFGELWMIKFFNIYHFFWI